MLNTPKLPRRYSENITLAFVLLVVLTFIGIIIFAANSFKASDAPETLELKKFAFRHQMYLDIQKGAKS